MFLFVRFKDVELVNLRIRPGNCQRQEPDQLFRHALDDLGIEQIGTVFEDAFYSQRLPACPICFAKIQCQIELCGVPGDWLRLDFQPLELHLHRGCILQHQHDLEERLTRSGAFGLERVYDTFEWNVPISEGI